MENQEEKKEVHNNAQGVTGYLATLKPLTLANDERVAAKFVDLYNRVHGGDKGSQIYEVEKFHFSKLIADNKNLQDCHILSLYGAFMDVAVQDLSFDPSKKLAYLMPGNVNIGTRDNPQWEKRANLQISPYGELFLRQYYGQIRSADNPVVVYEGDEFSVITGKEGRIVNHTAVYPRKSSRAIACFIRLVKIDGTIDFGVMDEIEMARLKEYSKKKNNGTANALYGKTGADIDTGFLIAKTVKHAFKAYPKVRLRGAYTRLESEVETPEETISYDLVDDGNNNKTNQPVKEEVKREVINTNPTTVAMTVTKTEDEEMF